MDQRIEPVELRTDRLRLDQPRIADAGAIAEICADPEIARWIPVMPHPYRRPDAVRFVEEFVPRGWATGEELTWVLRLANDRVVGSVGMRVAEAEIGYWLGRPDRGRGYMREAVLAVVDWWFAAGHDRITWKCLHGNVPSTAVARATGFRYLRSDDVSGDTSRFLFAELRSKDSRSPKPGWPTE